MSRYTEALVRNLRNRPEARWCLQIGSDGPVEISWGRLGEDCGAFQRSYSSAGITPGDQIMIFLRHRPELYGAFFGAMLSGLTPAFMPCASPRQNLNLYWSSHQTLMQVIAPAAVVTDRVTLAEMRAAGLDLGQAHLILVEDLAPGPLQTPDIPEDAIALLQHSSGTTGLKKGVALSHRAIAAQVESYADALSLDPAAPIVSWLPLYHDMGLIACMIMPGYIGNPVTHLDPFHWIGRPGTLLDELEAQPGAFAWLPNFAFEHLATVSGREAERRDLSSVAALINCSEPCKPATFDRFAEVFAPSGVRQEQLQCCYAMAETVFAVTQTRPGERPTRIRVDPASLQIGSTPVSVPAGRELIETGSTIDGLTVATYGPDGALLPTGAVGEIAIAGDFLFSGYNRDPERTAERLRDGWYFTRDTGFVRDGRLYVLGRLDDLIIINGRNLYAHEVEAQLTRIDGLKPGRAVAIAAFDQRVGSEVLVILAEKSKTSGRADAEIRREITSVLQSVFEVGPRAIDLMAEGDLIKTTSGKISRSENLKRYVARKAAMPA